MKKIIVLAFILFSTVVFSQQKKFNYTRSTNPTPKNELSLFLKEEISKKKIRKAKFSKTNNIIILSFNLDIENNPVNISVSPRQSSDLYNSLKDAFKKYPLEKLNIYNLNRKNRYSLQIISKKGRRNIFNTSSKIIVEKPAIINSCKDLNYFEDIENCLIEEVKKHFYTSFDFSKLTKKEEQLFIQFIINKNGKLTHKKSKKPLYFLSEINASLNSFPKIETVGTFNDTKIETIHSFKISLKEGETPVYENPISRINKIIKPTTDNPFSEYLFKNLSPKILEKADLNRINSRLSISFELDENSEAINLTSNSRSENLEKEIFSLFKKYSIEKLNIADKSKFSRHCLQILSFENNKIKINTSTRLTSERDPIFPDCENSKDRKELRKCFNKGVQMHFSRKFDADLPNRLALSPGRKRVFIGFKINTNGDIIAVKVRAPHPSITKEVKKVIYLFPKIIPAKQNGKNVAIGYNIPFTLVVQSKKR